MTTNMQAVYYTYVSSKYLRFYETEVEALQAASGDGEWFNEEFYRTLVGCFPVGTLKPHKGCPNSIGKICKGKWEDICTKDQIPWVSFGNPAMVRA